MEKKKIIIGTFVALILIGAACAGTVYYYLFAPQFHPKKTVYIYIDRDDTADSIYNKVEQKLTTGTKLFSGRVINQRRIVCNLCESARPASGTLSGSIYPYS